MVIRKAMKSDGAALDALLTKLIRDETQYDPNLSPEVVIKDNYAERIEEEGSGAFVAEEDGNIVGYLYGFLYQIPGMMLRPVAIMDALYVEEAYRGQGIAKELFRRFWEFAEDCHADRVELKVLSGNAKAITLYETLGFYEKKKYMELPLMAENDR